MVSWTRKNNIFLPPFTAENLASRDRFGRPVPRQPAHSPHSGRVWCLLAGFFTSSAPVSSYLYRQSPSDQSRVYQLTKLRTDGVHCREAVGTGPDVLKVVPVTDAFFSGIAMDQLMCTALFAHPQMVCSGYRL